MRGAEPARASGKARHDDAALLAVEADEDVAEDETLHRRGDGLREAASCSGRIARLR